MDKVEKVGGEGIGQTSSVKQVIAASLIGTTVEWYDFILYATAAGLVFGQLFFPTFDPLVGTLAAFATFGVGFFARPVGGAIFGHFGDRIGRKAMLVLSLLLMGGATFLIGLLPSYESIGIWATILLVVLRLVQGLALGGEWGGAVLMAVEYSTPGRRGFYGSFPQVGVPLGVILATLAFLAVGGLSEEQFLAWGWRVPFLLSIVLVGIGLFIRLRIMETPVFSRVKRTGTEARMPIIDVFRAYPKQVMLATGSFLAVTASFYVLVSFMPSYVTTAVGASRNTILTIILLSSAVGCLALPAFGALSDRFGRRPVYLAGMVGIALGAFPLFWLMDTNVFALMFLGHVALMIFLFMGFGPQAALYAELFPTRVRYSGVSAGYQLGTVLGGGFTPFIATALLAAYGTTALISVFLVVLAAISFVSVFVMPETYKSDIEEESLKSAG